MSGNDNASAQLEQLSRISLRDHTLESLVQRVCELAVDGMPGDLESSLSVLRGTKASTAGSTGQLALECDERQYEAGDGPCLHAASSGEVTEVPDIRTEPRWRNYMVQAAERGARSSLSIPMPITADVGAALNIYAREPRAFDDGGRTVATWFAPYAAVALANMHAYLEANCRADNLQMALESRGVIDRAKGILMERHKLTADQAFQVLARTSMQRNRKLRTVADELVTTGHLHTPSTRR
jgi:GAF domain-containing protein